jgi:hypothetical protein
MMPFTSPEDRMSEFTDSPTFKLIHEDVSVEVGDKASIDIKKSERTGV